MMWRSLVITIVACTLPSPPIPRAPVVVAPMPVFPQPFTFSPDGEPLRYGEALPAPTTTPFDDAVIAATKATPDARLFRACAALATIHDHLDPEAVELAWSWNGLIERPGRPVVVRTDDPHKVVTALGDVPAGSHIGIGHHGDTVVVAVTTPAMTTAPFARTAPVDRGFTIDAKLEPTTSHPQLEVAWDDRSEQRVTPTVANRAFSALVPCRGHSGHGVVSIVGLTGVKAAVIARFGVWCGIEPPRGVTIDPLHDASGDADPDRAAHRLFTLVQRERVTAGVPPLVWDDAVAATARQHAADLRTRLANDATGPADQGSPIAAASVRETMAVASSIDDAFARLMADPQRHAILMSPALTSSGVGVVASEDGQVYVAQIFVRTPSAVAAEAVARDLETRIHDADADIKVDRDLSAIARSIATATMAGLDNKKLDEILDTGLRRVKDRYVKLLTSVSTTVDLPSIDPITLVNAPQIDHVGIAVVQGHHPTLGDNTIWIFIVMARRNDI